VCACVCVCMCVHVCLCKREKEREGEREIYVNSHHGIRENKFFLLSLVDKNEGHIHM
jgi:hypothetical protein